MNIAIFGMGRVGLPLALVFAEHGQSVMGVDIDEKRVEAIRSGVMPFLEKGADALLKKHVNMSFKATTNSGEAVEKSDVIIFTLGTPVDEHVNPIFTQIESALLSIKPHLRKGQLLILRSTVSPGATEYIKRFIEKHSGFTVGKDFFLAFCPERIAEGFSIEELPEIPQIIGTMDKESAARAEAVFRTFNKKILHSDEKSAELAKIYTNMYRYINFAIANEFMMIADAHGRNIYDIIELVNRDYKRGGLKQPGLTAGPCLFKDGFFLINKIPFSELISVSWKLNESVPAYLISKIQQMKPLESAKVALLGLAFKKNLDDTRNALSFKAKKIFLAEGAQVAMHDPYVKNDPIEGVLKDADVIFIAMNHDYYRDLDPEMIKKNAKKDAIVCDIWNMLGLNKVFYKASEIGT
ncbi:TPA: nucleotide sugar dehydrogenase [Candidatus Woesearchaeota archaeon]|nr:nucleotide sugar dehydrogenase [Candidatus Woesearchaeota archaeon]